MDRRKRWRDSYWLAQRRSLTLQGYGLLAAAAGTSALWSRDKFDSLGHLTDAMTTMVSILLPVGLLCMWSSWYILYRLQKQLRSAEEASDRRLAERASWQRRGE